MTLFRPDPLKWRPLKEEDRILVEMAHGRRLKRSTSVDEFYDDGFDNRVIFLLFKIV